MFILFWGEEGENARLKLEDTDTETAGSDRAARG